MKNKTQLTGMEDFVAAALAKETQDASGSILTDNEGAY